MSNIDVFSDAVNESFGYAEVEWEGNTYLVDLSNDKSIRKLIAIMANKRNEGEVLSSLVNFIDRPEFLNKLIEVLPDDILKNSRYMKFHEEHGNQNWVLYNKRQFFVENDSKKYLHCHGYTLTEPVEQPINVSSLYSMFEECYNEQALNLSHWDVSHVVDMGYTFSACESLTSLGIANWNTSKVRDMRGMFNHCKSLFSLDVANWDTSNVMFMAYMFNCCKSLQNLNVVNWDTSNVLDYTYMFGDCTSLMELDLFNWNLNSSTGMKDIFNGCSSLVTTHNPELDKHLGGN